MKKKKYIIFLSEINAFFVKNTVDMVKLNNNLHVTHEFEKAKHYSTMKAAETIAKQYISKLPQIMTVEEEITFKPIGLTEIIRA